MAREAQIYQRIQRHELGGVPRHPEEHMHGAHLVKAYGRTQSNIALSSGEAEFYGLVSTASEALGRGAMIEDVGDKVESYLYDDASAAIGVANREGLGRIRHLDTQSLWLQQALREADRE